MLVSELRKVLEKYNNEDKDKIIVELYKRIPKGKKEDYDIDNFILNIKNNNKISKEEKKISIDELEEQVNYFIMCADNNLYSSPNKIISKSERSKWRFKVKKFHKELNSFKPDTIEGLKATDLLKSLYRVLSVGSNYLTFSNWETFRAIQISQSEFLGNVVSRKLVNGINIENMEYCIDLLDMPYDPYDLHSSVLLSFESCLKTVESKHIAIEILKKKVDEKNEYLKELKNNNKRTFNCEERINYFVECICYIYFSLLEEDDGIKYFHKSYINTDIEIKEYILLNFLEKYELKEAWINEYEKNDKIDYREELKEKYEKFKNEL